MLTPRVPAFWSACLLWGVARARFGVSQDAFGKVVRTRVDWCELRSQRSEGGEPAYYHAAARRPYEWGPRTL